MRISVRFARVFSLSGLLLAGASFVHPARADQAATATPPVVVAQRVPESFADLAAKLLPAVVNVSTTQTVRADSDDDDEDDQLPQMPNFPQGSPFEKFFHDFMNRQTEPDAPSADAGTGFWLYY